MFNFRLVLLLFLIFISNLSFADYYSWVVGGKTQYGEFGSPSTACSVVGRSWFGDGHSYGAVYSEDNVFNCTQNGYVWGNAIRGGTRCPENTTYDRFKGECVDNVPEIESFEFLFCYNYSGGDDCEAGTKQEVPREICKNGYVYEPSYSSEYTSCYGITSSSPAIYCSSVADLTSKTCSSEYQKQPADNSCPEGKKPGQVNGKFYCAGGETGGGETGGGETGGGETGGGEGEGGSSGGGETGGGEGEGGSGGGSGSGGGGSGSGSGGETGGGEGEGGSSGGGGGSSGGGSSGSGEGAGEGAGQGESVDGCENCSFGDERGDPFDGEVPSFSESLNRATDAMKKSPIAQSIGKISFSSGGSCPVGNTAIETPLGTIPLNFVEHCELWEKISPVLSAVFLAFWALVSVRVFLSA